MDDDLRTLWVGDLDSHWDEGYLHTMFAATGQVIKTKIIRDGGPTPYGFVEFQTRDMAAQVLAGYNGHPISGTNKSYRLNWAQHNVGAPKPVGVPGQGGVEYSIFVGDLSPEVTDDMLVGAFSQHYGSVKAAQVMIDSATGQSKKYGFVRFWDQGEQVRAQSEMNGQLINGRAIRCGPAAPKNTTAAPPPAYGGYGGYGGYYGYGAQGYGYPPPAAPPAAPAASPGAATTTSAQDQNATVFVGGLDGNTSEESLHATFSYFGAIKTCRVPEGKNCGFVEFVYPQSAEQAIATMHQQYIGSAQVRCEWGKSRTASGGAPAAPAWYGSGGTEAQPDYTAQWQEYYAQQQQQQEGQTDQKSAIPAQHVAVAGAASAATAPTLKHVDGVTTKLDVSAINERCIADHSRHLLSVSLRVN